MEEIQFKLEELSNMCLEEEGFNDYTDQDLINATLVFTHFFLDHIFSSNKGLAADDMEELAVKSGEAVRELIRAATGKDMHELVARIGKEENEKAFDRKK